MTARVSTLARALCAAAVCVSLVSAASANVFNMGPGLTSLETVPVGNPGNPGQLSGAGANSWGFGPDAIVGGVNYEYNIGKYPVTAGQYTVFLNAMAATDTYGLYNTQMWTHPDGPKIQRHGSPGSYTYSVAGGWANRPVSRVNWGDAARFANWLHNGQPIGAQGPGTTETGAYTLNGAKTRDELLAVSRNADWEWAITSEDEWYKAAYHKNDGVTGNYWVFPTSSDIINTGMANYLFSVGSTTDVGAYPYPSPYGTFDQGGNVFEWTEAVIMSYRGIRGGSFHVGGRYMRASARDYDTPEYAYLDGLGFRVVQVPEPGTLALLALGAVRLLKRRRNVRG